MPSTVNILDNIVFAELNNLKTDGSCGSPKKDELAHSSTFKRLMVQLRNICMEQP